MDLEYSDYAVYNKRSRSKLTVISVEFTVLSKSLTLHLWSRSLDKVNNGENYNFIGKIGGWELGGVFWV